VIPARLKARLTDLEATARARLGPKADDPLWRLAWLTEREFDRLVTFTWIAGRLPEEATADYDARAEARAVLGVDMYELRLREKESAHLCRLDHPDRPGDKAHQLMIMFYEDQVEPGRFYIDDWYGQNYPTLPLELSRAQLEQVSVRHPWPGPIRRSVG
jgi:hypothetical protein